MVNAQDRTTFAELIRHFDREKPSLKHPDQLILEIGKFFLGIPYAGSLETKAGDPIVNLRNLTALLCREWSRWYGL
jgi:hypothetical protein